jgi:hypothetical protein
MCPRAPFYRETKGLLHSESTPGTQGIFLVWTCTWMPFSSHTFTSLPLVHTPNPDFLRRRLWLGFPLIRESPHPGNLHTSWLPNSNFSKFSNFADFQFRDFAGSWLRVFTGSRPQGLTGSRFQIFTSSRFLSFAGPGPQISASPRLRSFIGSRLPKTYFTNFIKLDVSRVTCFPEFPNRPELAEAAVWFLGAVPPYLFGSPRPGVSFRISPLSLPLFSGDGRRPAVPAATFSQKDYTGELDTHGSSMFRRFHHVCFI